MNRANSATMPPITRVLIPAMPGRPPMRNVLLVSAIAVRLMAPHLGVVDHDRLYHIGVMSGMAGLECDRERRSTAFRVRRCSHHRSLTGAPPITSMMRARVAAVVSFGSSSSLKNPCAMIS